MKKYQVETEIMKDAHRLTLETIKPGEDYGTLLREYYDTLKCAARLIDNVDSRYEGRWD
mgnify:CR=1 FL=1